MLILNQLLKTLQDWQKLLKLKKQNKKEGTDIDDDAAADAAILAENKNLNKVHMTDGARDKTLGINKKLVNLAIIFIVTIIAVAFLYKAMGNDEQGTSKSAQPQNTQEQVPASSQWNGDSPLDYKDPNVMRLAQAEQAAKGKNHSSAEQTVKDKQEISDIDNSVKRSNSSAPTARTAPSAAASYSAPYALPSAAPPYNGYAASPVQATRSVEHGSDDTAKEKEKEKSLAERFKSAIAFSLGKETNADSSIATASSDAGSGSFSYSAPSDNVLQAGTIIPVMLYSGINTDTPGQVTAQVETDVYDTATNSRLLIPAGSRILGSYEAGATESGRVNVNFSAIVLPDGSSYSAGSSMVAVDGQGYNGIQGTLHRHAAQKISRGLFNAAFTALSTISVDRVTLGADTFNNLTSNEVKPTITVNPGYEFNVYVTQPIFFLN